MTLLTLYPTIDTYVDQGAPDTNFGTNTELIVEYDNSGGKGLPTQNRYPYLRYDLSGEGITYDQVDSAYLYARTNADINPTGTFGKFWKRLAQDWDESTATWNTEEPATLGTEVSDALYVCNDDPESLWWKWTITDLVIDALQDRSGDLNISLRHNFLAANNLNSLGLHSSDQAEASIRPYIEINHTGAATLKSVTETLTATITDGVKNRFYRQPDSSVLAITDIVNNRFYSIPDTVRPITTDSIAKKYNLQPESIIPVLADTIPKRYMLEKDTLTPVLTDAISYRLFLALDSLLTAITDDATVEDMAAPLKSVSDTLTAVVTDVVRDRYYLQPDVISAVLTDVVRDRLLSSTDDLALLLIDSIKSRLMQAMDDVTPTLADTLSARFMRQLDTISLVVSDVTHMSYDLVKRLVYDVVLMVLSDRLDINRLRWTRLFAPTELDTLPPGVAAAPSSLLAHAGSAGPTPAQGQGQSSPIGRAGVVFVPKASGSIPLLTPGQAASSTTPGAIASTRPLVGYEPEPTILSTQIQSDLDDAFERYDSGGEVVAISVAYPVISLVGVRSWTCLNFTQGPFPPQGSTILEAHITVQPILTLYDDANMDIYAEVSPDPAPFLAGLTYNISNRVKTIASVPWVQDGLGVGFVDSPPLASVIQELVNGHSLQAVAIILKPRDAPYKRLFIRYLVSQLHISWIPPYIASPPAGAVTATIPGGAGSQPTIPPSAGGVDGVAEGEAREEERWP